MSTGSQGEVDDILADANTVSAKGFLALVSRAWAIVMGGWRAPPRHEYDEQEARAEQATIAVKRALDEGRQKAGIV